MLEFHEMANLFPLIEGEEFAALVEDIRAHGLELPIHTYEGKILDGRNRYRACLEAGREPHYKVYEGDSPASFVVSMNKHRRHLTSSQIAMAAVELEKLLAVEAEARMKAGVTLSNSFDKGRASAQAATIMGTNQQYVLDAKKVITHSPELAQQVIAGTITLPEATREIKRDEYKQQIKHLSEAGVVLPTGKYACIVIDPPWPVGFIDREERPNQIGFPYPPMSIEEIQAFPIPEIADDNCHLYLWVVHSFLHMALHLVEHWGFEYRFLMTWVKNVGFTPYKSAMRTTEHILFCTKGSLPILDVGQPIHFHADVRQHSRKPDEFYEMVRRRSPSPRIDVFSREARDGFAQFGNEIEKYSA